MDPEKEETEELMKLMASGLVKGVKLGGAKPGKSKHGPAGKPPGAVHVKIKPAAAQVRG